MNGFSFKESIGLACNLLYPLVAVGIFPAAAAAAAPLTTVDITVATGITRSLVFTIQPTTSVTGGVKRVAAVQTVVSEVFIDFGQDLPLYWLASAKRTGEVAPNQDANLYYSTNAHDPLTVAPGLTIVWSNNGWKIPPFDPSEYTVQMGIGLRLGDGGNVSWAYSVPCTPNSTLVMDVSGYAIYQSDGEEELGDAVDLDQPNWTLLLGNQYSLSFDQTGVGELVELP